METIGKRSPTAETPTSATAPAMITNWLFRTQEGVLFTIVVIMWIFLSFRSDVFLTERNVGVLLSQVSMVAISAVGMTLLLIAGEVDLSVGSMQAFVGVVVMTVLNDTGNLFIGIAAGLLVGLIVGLLNSIATVQLGINSLIATLAMLNVVRGSAYSYTNAAVQNDHKIAAFTEIGNGFLLRIPWPVIIFAVVFAVFIFIMARTTFGRYVQAVGGNPRAAGLSGVRVKQIKMICFILTSMLTSLSAIILLSRLNSGQNNAGFGFELQVVGAVLLGGTSLFGGEGTLLGTLFAVLLLGTLSNATVLLDINSNWQMALTGFAILIAVFVDTRRKRRVGGD